MNDIRLEVKRAPLSSLVSGLARTEFKIRELDYKKQEIMREIVQRELDGKIKGTKLEKL